MVVGSEIEFNERLKYYAPLVKILFFKSTVDGWLRKPTRVDAKSLPSPALFPNLQQLDYTIHKPDGTCFLPIDSLLSSSLKSLHGHIHSADSVGAGNFTVDVLRVLDLRHAQLNAFEIYTSGGIESPELSEMIGLLRKHPLRRLSLRIHGQILESTQDPSALIQFLGQMDGLKSLSILSQDSGLSQPLPPQSFRNLESISITCHSIISLRWDLEHQPVAPENRRLVFEGFSRFRNLRRIRLIVGACATLSFDVFRPILKCPLVEDILWYVPMDFVRDSIQLEAMLSAWPRLHMFSFARVSNIQLLTANDLLLFAKYCPLLEEFDALVDFTNLDDGVPDVELASGQVKVVYLRDSKVGRKTQNVARFISQLWPNLTSLDNDRPSTYQLEAVRRDLMWLKSRVA
ncbi:hypothetical protein FRB99_002609 [Tulasnella sp. 403]|nr:hypothetical protein FRB99_002609 [Tulasnella sp. 403]